MERKTLAGFNLSGWSHGWTHCTSISHFFLHYFNFLIFSIFFYFFSFSIFPFLNFFLFVSCLFVCDFASYFFIFHQ